MHVNSRYNQEAAIAHDPLKVGPSSSFSPSYELVSLYERPGCAAETHGANATVGRTVNQIPDLGPHQRTTSKVMMFVHEASPSHGRLTVTACDHLNVNTPHIGETTRDTGNFGRASLPTFQWTLNPAAPFGMRKIDETFAVQNGQGLAAGR